MARTWEGRGGGGEQRTAYSFPITDVALDWRAPGEQGGKRRMAYIFIPYHRHFVRILIMPVSRRSGVSGATVAQVGPSGEKSPKVCFGAKALTILPPIADDSCEYLMLDSREIT